MKRRGQTVSLEPEGQWHKTYDFIVEVFNPPPLPTPIPHPVPCFLHAGERKLFRVYDCWKEQSEEKRFIYGV